MKERELREAATCAVCGDKIGKGGVHFYRVKVDMHVLNLPALQRQQGLAMMMNGNGMLASVMGPDEDMTEVTQSAEFTVCGECGLTGEHPVAYLLERASR